MRKILKVAIPLASILFASSCGKDAASEDSVEIINDPALLDGRVSYMSEPLSLNLDLPIGANLDPKKTNFEVVAEVQPPEGHKGQRLRATHISALGHFIYVTYNREGEDYGGAVDVLDISNPEKPILVSQAVFKDADLSSAYVDNVTKKLYVVGARSVYSTGNATPGIMDEITLMSGKLTSAIKSVKLPGWVGNSVVRVGSYIYATSGNADGVGADGGLYSFGLNQSSYLKPYREDTYHRAVAMGSNGQSIVSLELGKAAKLHLYKPGLPDVKTETTLDLGSVPDLGGKHSVTVNNFVAYVSLGYQGIRGYDLKNPSNTPSFYLSNPKPQAGEAEADVVTNSISHDSSYLYVAQGGAGLSVCALPAVAGKPNTELQVVGQFHLGDSVNFATASNKHLLVATSDGVKIILKKF